MNTAILENTPLPVPTPAPERVADFMPTRYWVDDHGGALFKTHSSLEWFCRLHRQRLIESGQYIIRRGKSGNLVGPRFDEVVLDILREQSAAQVEVEAL